MSFQIGKDPVFVCFDRSTVKMVWYSTEKVVLPCAGELIV